MKKGFKYATKDEKVPNLTSSHPGERLLAARINKPKGVQNKDTKVKQSLGLDNWNKLCEYVTNEGALKYIDTLEQLDQKDYIIAFNAILEYIKPKLIRNNNINVNVDIDSISFE